MSEEYVRSVQNVIKRVLATREGGAVRRCHTRRVIGEQTVAQHQYNALSLLMLLYPGEPTRTLIEAVLWHDVGERITGDLYGPFKSRHPTVGAIVDQYAETWLHGFGLARAFRLSQHEQEWLAAVDLLEFYLWALEQRALGNSTFERDIAAARTTLTKSIAVPSEVSAFALEYEHHQTLED